MKEYPERIRIGEIWHLLENFPLAHLATIDGDQPRVRPMSLISYNEGLWLTSKSGWSKVEQIRRNQKVESTVAPRAEKSTGSIRVTAIAEIIEDLNTKAVLASVIPWFRQYWNGGDDPNFTLFKIKPTSMLYDNPYDGKKYTVVGLSDS